MTNDTKLVVGELMHFATYNIEVQACHDPVPDKNNPPQFQKLCSQINAVASVRTKALRKRPDMISFVSLFLVSSFICLSLY